MRIAFVGKGGSGKTTIAALFIQHLAHTRTEPILAIDADINMHLGPLLRIERPASYLSAPNSQARIKEYIWNKSPLIASMAHIKKTTPPSRHSGFFDLHDENNLIYRGFSSGDKNVHLAVVGTYEEEDVGRSCYHNNLSILENILSHSIDHDAYVVVDMVAGTDAFAGSLHTQFDLTILAVEPTQRSVAVYDQYLKLAHISKTEDTVFVVGNKVENDEDREFIEAHIPCSKILGHIGNLGHVRRVDRGSETLDAAQLSTSEHNVLEVIRNTLVDHRKSYSERLQSLTAAHRVYIAQQFVVDRFGDLTTQIDTGFNFDAYAKNES